MSLKNVIDRFALVSGVNQNEISQWIFLIADCIKYFESMLKGKTVDDTALARLNYACAVYAYYKYSMLSSTMSAQKFKAGDVEISTCESAIDRATVLWQNAKSEIADIIDFDSFEFVRVIS